MGRRMNGDGNVNKMANGRYKINVRYQGIRKTFYGDTEREAKDKLRQFQRDCYYGVNLTGITVTDAVERWLTSVKKVVLKPASYDRLEQTYKLYVKDAVDKVPLKGLTVTQCQNIINANAEILAYSTVKKIYEFLKASLGYYVRAGDISKNPMDLVVMPRESSFAKKTKEIVIPSEDDMEKLMEAASHRLPNGRALYTESYVEAIKILSNTGMRIGELLALTEDKISLDNATIRIDSSVSEITDRDALEGEPKLKRIITEPKTKSGIRTIAINSETIKAIKTLRQIYSDNGYDSKFLILNTKGNPATAHDIERTLKNICRAAGIKPFGPHALRHYFASRCIANNADIVVLSKHLGHSRVSITLNTYAHLLNKQSEEFKKLLETL